MTTISIVLPSAGTRIDRMLLHAVSVLYARIAARPALRARAACVAHAWEAADRRRTEAQARGALGLLP